MDNVKNALDLCTLLRCALHGQKPAWEAMDLQAVYTLSKNQMLAAMAYMALEGTGGLESLAPETAEAWKKERDMAVRKNLLMTAERQKILRKLDEAGIWYLPLKGSILADYYPRLGMRQMADNDILVDASRRKDMQQIMLSLGFTPEELDRSNHDEFQKPPIFNFEMHVALIGAGNSLILQDYYRDIHTRLLPDGGFARRFREEDFYIYFLVHAYKHFQKSGNGLRFLVDTQVYLEKKGGQLDMNYVNFELEKLGIADFEAQVRALAEKLFGTAEALTRQEEEMMLYCVHSGTFGNLDNRVNNQMRQLQGGDAPITGATRVKYALTRIWPDQQWFRDHYPFLARWKLFQPFFVVYRGLRALVLRGRSVLRELRLLRKKSE